MFLHSENQQLLWQTLQKTPYLVEFSQKFTGYKDEWFRGSNEQFYTQWISQRGRVPTNARELLEINKCAIQFMVSDLKRILGYSSSQFSNNKTSFSANELPSYNVAAERQQREDMWSSNFNKYQSEYNKLLERPEVPVRVLPSESSGEKIQNMEELLKEHARMREMDIEIISSSRSPPSQSPSSTYREVGNTLMRNNTTTNPTRIITPRLKIMDEIENAVDIERIEMDIHESSSQPKKMVHWLSETTSEATYKSEATSKATYKSEATSEVTLIREEDLIREADLSESRLLREANLSEAILIRESNDYSSNPH